MLEDVLGGEEQVVRIRAVSAALLTLFVVVLAGCGGDSAPTATPLPPTATSQPTSVVVTFRVAGVEEYRIELIDPQLIAVAQKLLAGEEAPKIPNGLVVRGDPGVNVGYTWHIDPNSVEFVDVAIEVCDGLPSFVERGEVTSDRYCPWDAQVIAIEPRQ